MIAVGPRRGARVAPQNKEHEVQRSSYEPLCKQEIDRRIAQLASDVAASVLESPAGVLRAGAARPGPQWITPRALVEKMKHFIVYN